jgi:hypothetical protein
VFDGHERVTTRAIVATLIFAVTVWGVPPTDVYRFGRLGGRLPTEDMDAIVLAAGGDLAPVALVGWYSQILPEVRYVDLFLQPTVVESRLIRGTFVHLECSPQGNQVACLKWKRAEAVGAYGQVADGAVFTTDVSVRTPRERPFRVHGDFSNSDLVSLVAYVRTGPSPRAKGGWTSTGISGLVPISDIHRETDGSARVLMTEDGYVFELAKCVRVRKGWQIIEASGGVA